MLRIPPRYLDQQQAPANRELPVVRADANGWLDGIGTHLDQKGVQLDHLRARQILYISIVGCATH